MRTFLHLVRLAVMQQTTYRTALIAGLATNFFFGIFRAAMITALYGGREQVNGLSLPGALTFVAVGQAMIAFLTLFGSYDLMGTVYSGQIAGDLVRPVGLFRLWLARDLGRSLVNLVVRGLVLVAVFAFFYRVLPPAGSSAALWMGVSVVLSWLVSFAWRFLVNLAAFWTPDARGIGRGAFTFSQLLSGFIIPLSLYPDWFSRLCAWTPFPAMFNVPVEIYLGLLQGAALWRALLVQAAWFVLLGLACGWALRSGVRRLVIQGG